MKAELDELNIDDKKAFYQKLSRNTWFRDSLKFGMLMNTK